MEATFKQEKKNKARHTMIRKAVELLTTDRTSACCVRRSYVRDLYDYYIQQDESREKEEASNIDMSYIRTWEEMHIQKIGTKRASDLSVCYFAGPEPDNDFMEFISMGVLPQNIWAFESEYKTYQQALESIDSTDFLQPKLLKVSIERFFENTPMKFDIVYIDSCSTLVSDQHALRCIASMFKYHRLKSPGVLISNFSEIDPSNSIERNDYNDLITRYYCVKDDIPILVERDNKIEFSSGYNNIHELVTNNFNEYYGNFITAMICNSGSISIPALRFVNSTYMQNLSNQKVEIPLTIDVDEINKVKNNTLYKYSLINQLLLKKGIINAGVSKNERLLNELSANWNASDLFSCLRKLHKIRKEGLGVNPEIKPIAEFFDDAKNLYQFLDKPNRVLFFDLVINQLSYPMHYCSNNIHRLTYVAKKKRMFTDLILFDECRYIYDWLPAIHQIKNAFSNLSWQYTFRFALDGLIKQRIAYNDEFFYQGSVIRKDAHSFETATISERENIY